MKLTRVDITYFRCFEHLSVPLHPGTNMLVGRNGAGKTTILDSIAIGLADVVNAIVGSRPRRKDASTNLSPLDIHIPPGSTDPELHRKDYVQVRMSADSYYELPDFVSRTDSGTKMQLEWSNYLTYAPARGFRPRPDDGVKRLDEYFAALWEETRKSQPNALIPFPVAAYYRANRGFSRTSDWLDAVQTASSRQKAFDDALDASANYRDMIRWFYFRENEELREGLQLRRDPSFEYPDLRIIRQALARVLEGVERVYFRGTPPSLMVELTNAELTPRVLDVAQLSEGYRDMLGLVLDFARRLAQAHPNWPNPLEAPGILLIDEIEAHLHPRWQQTVIPSLRSVFPNTQIIATTHSPQVLTTVERQDILVLRNRELRAVSIETSGAESNRVSQEVMHTDTRPPNNENADRIRHLYGLIRQDEFDEALAVCEQLVTRLGPDDPALVEAQAIIKNRQWEKELGL